MAVIWQLLFTLEWTEPYPKSEKKNHDHWTAMHPNFGESFHLYEVECRTPEREVRGSRPTVAVLCPWARHFTPRKYWLITQEAMAPSRHDWKIVDWDVKPQHNQPTNHLYELRVYTFTFIIAFSWRKAVIIDQSVSKMKMWENKWGMQVS